MELLVAIQIAKALAGAIEDGIPVAQKAIQLLKSSDEPEAIQALAELKAFYDSTGAAADAALEIRITLG